MRAAGTGICQRKQRRRCALCTLGTARLRLVLGPRVPRAASEDGFGGRSSGVIKRSTFRGVMPISDGTSGVAATSCAGEAALRRLDTVEPRVSFGYGTLRYEYPNSYLWKMLPRVIRAAHQRAGLDIGESESARVGAERRELFWRNVALDR